VVFMTCTNTNSSAMLHGSPLAKHAASQDPASINHSVTSIH